MRQKKGDRKNQDSTRERKKEGGEMRQHNKKSGKVGEQGDPTKGKEKGGEGGGREKPLSKGGKVAMTMDLKVKGRIGLKTCTKQGKTN